MAQMQSTAERFKNTIDDLRVARVQVEALLAVNAEAEAEIGAFDADTGALDEALAQLESTYSAAMNHVREAETKWSKYVFEINR